MIQKLGKDKGAITIEDIITNPIACGYFLRFCNSQFCSENLKFWIKVDNFKDKCKTLDLSDIRNSLFLKELAQNIWDEFLAESSSSEVSLPSLDRKSTIERMANFEQYRGEIFDIALNDPIKTLRKDTKGRFLSSKFYDELIKYQDEISAEIALKKIEVPKLNDGTDQYTDSKTDFTIDEILSDSILFSGMRKYLESIYSVENLLCLQSILDFEHSHSENEDMQEKAWNIYILFIAGGSPHEVSVTASDRKQIMMGLASAEKNMFEIMKPSTESAIRDHYNGFKASPIFQEVLQSMKQSKMEKDKPSNNTSKLSRFTKMLSPRKP